VRAVKTGYETIASVNNELPDLMKNNVSINPSRGVPFLMLLVQHYILETMTGLEPVVRAM
jgi:hypothetical protein